MLSYKILKLITNLFKSFYIFYKKIIQLFDVFFFIFTNSDYGKYPKNVHKFENKVCKILNSKYSISFSSATTAFDSILQILNLKKNSIVLTTDLIFNTFYLNTLYHDLKIELLKTDDRFQIKKSHLDLTNVKLVIITHPFGIIRDFIIDIFPNNVNLRIRQLSTNFCMSSNLSVQFFL